MPEILLRERDGAPLLRLYRTGGFWTAFERSAFLLCRLLPECRVNIALNPETKSPVVMTAVPDETLRPLGVRLGFPCGTAEYMEIPASETGAEEYSRWRRDEVGRFAPALTTII